MLWLNERKLRRLKVSVDSTGVGTKIFHRETKGWAKGLVCRKDWRLDRLGSVAENAVNSEGFKVSARKGRRGGRASRGRSRRMARNETINHEEIRDLNKQLFE